MIKDSWKGIGKMDLMELREQIDSIDKQIVELYEQRMDISRQVAEYKLGTGKKFSIRKGKKRSLER